MTKIVIAEAIPSQNKGEAAILWGMCETLDLLGETRVYLCSAEPRIDSQEYGKAVELIHDNVIKSRILLGKLLESLWLTLRHICFMVLYWFLGKRLVCVMRGPLWQAYLDADLLVMGHDNLLVARVPLNLCMIPLIAKTLGIPAVVYAGSVGPFNDPLTPIITRWLLNAVDLVTLRERMSLANVRSIGVHNSAVIVTADAAFLMPAASPDRVEEIMSLEGIDPDRVLIGITVTQDMAHRYAASKYGNLGDGYQAYMRMKASLVDYLIENYGVLVIAIAHSLGPEKRRDDRIANADVYRWTKNKDDLRIVENLYTSKELKGIIGRCALFVGERTHSMIAAASMGVPTIGISSRTTASKTRGIIGDMLGQNEWILEVESLEENTLIETVGKAWENRASTHADLQKRMPDIRARALNTGVLIKELLQNWGAE